MTSAFSEQNSIMLCPASFCTPSPNLPVTPGVSWLPTFAFQSCIMKRTFFEVLVLKGPVCLDRTGQLHLLQHYWLRCKLGFLWYWTVCLGKKQRSFIIFEIASKYCILDSFVDHDGYSIFLNIKYDIFNCRNWVSVDLFFWINSSCIYPCSVPQERKLNFMNCIRKFFLVQASTHISSKGGYEKDYCEEKKKEWIHANSLQLFLTLCDPTDSSQPGSSVHGILQARILEWVAMPSSRGSSQPSDQWSNQVSLMSPALAGGSFTTEPPRKPQNSDALF